LPALPMWRSYANVVCTIEAKDGSVLKSTRMPLRGTAVVGDGREK